MQQKLPKPEELPTWKVTALRRHWPEFVRRLRRQKFIAIVYKNEIVGIFMAPPVYRRLYEQASPPEKTLGSEQVRAAIRMTDETLADAFVTGADAKIERRVDLYLRTLRRFLQLAGGDLEVMARLGGEGIPILEILSLGGKKKS